MVKMILGGLEYKNQLIIAEKDTFFKPIPIKIKQHKKSQLIRVGFLIILDSMSLLW
jgi:hypothetical protein